MANIIYLQFFAEGEGAAAEASVATDGANALDTAENKTEKSREERYKEFKNEFKDEFQKDFNSNFGKRFKEAKQTEERLKSYEDTFKPLFEQYKVDNPSAFMEAFVGDKSRYFEESAETGESPEAIAAKRQLEYLQAERTKKEKEEKTAKENAEREEKIRLTMEEWRAEETKVKELHPEFDLQKALSNPVFQNGLRLGIPMLNLYRSMEFDSISKSITDVARQSALDEVRNGRSRPTEVGTDAVKAVSADLDVNSLSDSDIDEILKRVARGEKISFA